MTVYTKFFKMAKQTFDTSTWHDALNGNFDKLDGLLAAAGFQAVDGTWLNGIVYAVGTRVFDPIEATVWRCVVDHTSAGAGTFSADRLANPSYWALVDSGITVRGLWITSTIYSAGDIVGSNGSSYACIVSHISGTFSTDLAAGYWVLWAKAGDPGAPGAGTGDFVGPAVAADGNVITFDGTTGKLGKDGGIALSSLAPKANPTFTGSVVVPTQTAGDNTTNAANTAFVSTAIANLINLAPGALDTLNELATALGNDPNFATTVNAAIALRWNASVVHAYASKAVPVLTDEVPGLDSAGAFAAAKFTLTNILAAFTASVANFRGATGSLLLSTANVWAAMAEVALTPGTTVSWDMSAGIDFSISPVQNFTLANPTNTTVGKRGRIRIIQDATGSRVLTLDTNFKKVGGVTPVLSTAANAIDVLYYDCVSSTVIHVSMNKGMS